MRRPPAGLAVLIASVAAMSGACSSGADDETAHRTLTVFAAASLTETFVELGERFEEEHVGVEVRFNFDGSSGLAAQIIEGAPADVFAAADRRTMATVTDAGAAQGVPEIFATNTLQIVTPPGNAADVESLVDLARPDLKVVVCAPQVPCGAAASTLLVDAGIDVDPVSEEQNVADVLGKITHDAADAGLVYVTDAVAAGDDVTGVAVPEAAAVVNDYPIVTLEQAAHAGLAARFVAFVTSDEGRSMLEQAGFGSP